LIVVRIGETLLHIHRDRVNRAFKPTRRRPQRYNGKTESKWDSAVGRKRGQSNFEIGPTSHANIVAYENRRACGGGGGVYEREDNNRRKRALIKSKGTARRGKYYCSVARASIKINGTVRIRVRHRPFSERIVRDAYRKSTCKSVPTPHRSYVRSYVMRVFGTRTTFAFRRPAGHSGPPACAKKIPN